MSKTVYAQEPPFAVQIELVEGCNLSCGFCGLNGIRDQSSDRLKKLKFMTEGTLRSLMEQMVSAGWNPRVEFAVHGEPTLHPKLIKMIEIARVSAPGFQLMMTSNGGGLLAKPGPRQRIRELFDAGLNVLALDDYENVKIVSKIREALAEPTEDMMLEDVQFFEYPENPKGSPHARRPLKSRVVTFIASIDKADKGNHATLNNHAGAGAPPLKEPMKARCAKPFRELTVRWDGNVAISCNDWRGEFKCGNVVKHGLHVVWHSPQLNAARRFLMQGDRASIPPCSRCDAVSYRVGLLPDKMGKVTLPKPDARDHDLVRRACAGEPYTRPVLREWEKKK